MSGGGGQGEAGPTPQPTAPLTESFEPRLDGPMDASLDAKLEVAVADGGGEEQDAATRSRDARAEAAFALAGFGAFLFLPATASVFATPTSLFGLPAVWVYLFGGWSLLILGAAWLSWRRLTVASIGEVARAEAAALQARREAGGAEAGSGEDRP